MAGNGPFIFITTLYYVLAGHLVPRAFCVLTDFT